jgi:hypothetical protein
LDLNDALDSLSFGFFGVVESPKDTEDALFISFGRRLRAGLGVRSPEVRNAGGVGVEGVRRVRDEAIEIRAQPIGKAVGATVEFDLEQVRSAKAPHVGCRENHTASNDDVIPFAARYPPRVSAKHHHRVASNGDGTVRGETALALNGRRKVKRPAEAALLDASHDFGVERGRRTVVRLDGPVRRVAAKEDAIETQNEAVGRKRRAVGVGIGPGS